MNISSVRNCFGCGVCSIVCGRKIIEIKLNEDGFYEPCITNPDKCTDCGLCYDVCSFSHDDLALKTIDIRSYATWSKDYAIRKKCSSGGISYELARFLIAQGFKVCNVRYSPEKNRAEHYIATTTEELLPGIGSKYIQSYTVDGFKAINKGEKYLVTGTPCQVDSFRRYIQHFHKENDFILVDFFCHGVPSKLMWDKYISYVKRKVGNISHVSWRNKDMGWHDSWAMKIIGDKSSLFSQISQGDMFFRLFLSDTCLNKACYNHCRFKNNRSSADIRIGDFWGKQYQNNEEGVSAIVAFTSIGDEILHNCNCILIEHPFDVVSENQMKHSPMIPKLSDTIMDALKNPLISIETIYYILAKENKKQNYIYLIKNPLIAIKRILRKLSK